MKKKLLHNFFGKFAAGLLAVTLIITGALFMETDSSDVLAADTTKDFIAEEVQDINAYRSGETYTYPKKENYIFAGWYTDATCSTAYTTTTIEGVTKAYAKYIPADTLDVKFQVTAGTDAASESSNLRIVSSVDSTNYSKVGFKILSVSTGVEKTVESTEVYKRIKSNTKGLEYGYSPVIFDTDSEYFMTVTITGIKDFNKTYSARAYWVTLDGTEVTGTARNAKVSDSYNGIANIPVRLYSGDVINPVTVAAGSEIKVTYNTEAFTWLSDVDENAVAYEAGTMDNGVTVTKETDTETNETYIKCTVSQDIANPNGMLVNLRFKINSGAASTATFTMESETITNGLSDYVYNVYSTYYDPDLGPDTSWYDEFAETDETDFVIATARDLYGLASLVNENKERFEGDTIYLGADITVNKGQATASGWDTTKDADGNSITDGTEHEWEAIGVTYTFKGTFEGQENTISGIYLVDDDEYTTTAEYQGLFGQTDTGSTIRDFKLKNSYFENITGWFYDYSDNAYDGNYALMGSVVGQLKGNMDTVYSDAVVVSAHRHVGGLVGRTNGTMTISNCWFDGSLTVTEPELYGDAGGVGGILGRRASGNVTISNCLNTADITYSFDTVNADTTSYRVDVGGIAGYLKDANSGSILDCMNAGTVTVNAPEGVDVSNSYSEFCANGTKTHIVTASGDYTATFNGYLGYDAAKAKLDFYDQDTKTGYWVCRETADNAIDGIPILKSFCEEWIDIAWYYDDTTKSEFTINYAEELYGLSEITNVELVTFNNKTIYLGDDIKMNSGLASVWATDSSTEKRAFRPIGGSATDEGTTRQFKGTFDGQGHNISGLYISQESANLNGTGTGLFAYATYHIQNVSLTNSFIDSAKENTGSIAGYYTSTMTNVYSDAYVKSSEQACGGLVGLYGGTGDNSGESNVSIKDSWFAGNVEAPDYYVGGIVGLCDRGNEVKVIQNCLNSGTVESKISSGSTCVGGIIGGIYQTDASKLKGFKLSNCLNVGEIKYQSKTDAGSVLGYTRIPVTFENVYTTNELGTSTTGVGFIRTASCTSTGEPILITETDLTGNDAYIYTDLQFYDTDKAENVWGIVASDTPVIKFWYEKLFETNVETGHSGQQISTNWYYNSIYREGSLDNQTTEYIVEDAADLYGMATFVNSGNTFDNQTITLKKDGDFNLNRDWKVTSVSEDGTVASEGTPTEWIPIGTSDYQFAGKFDGNGNTICGVYVDNSSTKAQGLFGYSSADSMIQNFTLDSSSFIVGQESGCIVGISEGNIQNVYVTDLVVLSSTKKYIGGLVGDYLGDNEGTISNCWFDGTVVSSKDQLGGIIGLVYDGTKTIENCLFSGNVINTLANSDSNVAFVGGFVGRFYLSDKDSNSATLYITDCLSTGAVKAKDADAVGAILGRAGSTVVPTVEFKDVYYINEPVNSDGSDFNNTKTISGCGNQTTNNTYSKVTGTPVQLTNEKLTGTEAYKYTELDLGNKSENADSAVWVAMKSGTPQLNMFSDSDVDSFEGVQKLAKGWYYNELTFDTSNGDQTTLSFEIANADEMFGLADLVNNDEVYFNQGNTVTDGTVTSGVVQTITLTDDVKFNDATEGTEAQAWYKGEREVPANSWIPIGSISAKSFKGIFDGDGHTISGIYMDAKSDNSGLFGYTTDASVVQLTLVNSYFKSTASSVGSVIGFGGGQLDTIYSDTIVIGEQANVGGIVGSVAGGKTLTMDNCWFAGTVTNIGNSTSYRNTGGLIGRVMGNTTVNNCLNTGAISAPYYEAAETDSTTGELDTSKVWPYIGGMVGYLANKSTLTFSHCLNVGNITYNEAATKGYGSILGRANTGTTIEASSVYATTASCKEIALYYSGVTYDNFDVVTVVPKVIEGSYALDKVAGLFATDNVTDTGDAYWVTVEGAAPVLASFADKAVTGTEETATVLKTAIVSAEANKTTVAATLPSAYTTLSTPKGYEDTAIQAQGGCTDGTYFYQAYITYKDTENNEQDNKVVLVKSELDGTYVDQTDELSLVHANDITYNPKTNCLIVCHGKATKQLTCFDADTLEQVGETKTLSVAFYCIDYNVTYDCYVVGTTSTRYIYILDAQFNIIDRYESITCNPQKSTEAITAQGMCCDDEFLYFLFFDETGTYENHVITVFDWHGNYVTEISLDVLGEPENVSVIDGKLYVMNRNSDDSERHVYEVSDFKVVTE